MSSQLIAIVDSDNETPQLIAETFGLDATELVNINKGDACLMNVCIERKVVAFRSLAWTQVVKENSIISHVLNILSL